MNCKRCGRKNPSNVGRCIYCNTPLYNSGNRREANYARNRKTAKRGDNVIVGIIIALVLVLLLAIMGKVYMGQGFSSKKKNFGGGGGGSLPPMVTGTSKPQVSQSPIENIEDGVTEEEEMPEKEEKPKQTQKPDKSEVPVKTEAPEKTEAPKKTDSPSSNEKLRKKDEFLQKADEIEWYSETYLETAETQLEINSESSVVYKKWDGLLNEVYQYLKTIMSKSEFEKLQEEEMDWVAEKENAIKEAAAEWEGGSGEPMIKNLTAIKYTIERCYYLISLIN